MNGEQSGLQANIFQSIIATAIPRITDSFHSLDQIGWYGSAFFLTLASFQSTWGKAYKYFPLKAVFIWAIFIFELGSLLCGMLAPQFGHSHTYRHGRCCSEQQYAYCGPSSSWSRSRRHRFRLLYDSQLCSTSPTETSFYWYSGSHLRMRQCCWPSSWWSLYR